MVCGSGDMAQMNCSTTGTGTTITLNLAVTGYQTFNAAGIANNQTIRYSILDASNTWEIGFGIYNNATPSFTRATILYSSNSGGPINMTAAANVSLVLLNEDFLSLQGPTHAIGGYI